MSFGMAPLVRFSVIPTPLRTRCLVLCSGARVDIVGMNLPAEPRTDAFSRVQVDARAAGCDARLNSFLKLSTGT